MKRSTFFLFLITILLLVSCSKVTARIKGLTQSHKTEQVSKTRTKRSVTEEIGDLDKTKYVANRVDKKHPDSIEDKTDLVLKSIEKNGQYSDETYKDFDKAYIAYSLELASSFQYYDDLEDSLYLFNMTYDDQLAIINSWRQLEDSLWAMYGLSYVEELYQYSLKRRYGTFNSIEDVDRRGGYKLFVPPIVLTYLDELEVSIIYGMLDETRKCMDQLLTVLKNRGIGIIDERYCAIINDVSYELEQHGYPEHAISFIISYIDRLQQYDLDSITDESVLLKWFKIREQMETELGFIAWGIGDMDLLGTCVLEAERLSPQYSGYDYYKSFYDINELINQLILTSRFFESLHEKDQAWEYLSIAERLVKERATCMNQKEATINTKIKLYDDIARNALDYETAENAFNMMQQLDTTWSFARSLNHASFYVDHGKYEEAAPLLSQVLDFIKITPAVPTRWTKQALETARDIFIHDKNYELAHSVSRDLLSLSEDDFIRTASHLTSTSRKNYWEKYYSYSLETFAIFDLIIDSNKADVSYDAAIFHKGILKRMGYIVQNNILKSGDKELMDLYSEYKNALKDDPNAAFQKEKALMYQYSLHSEFNNLSQLRTWKDIHNKLNNDEVAIEFSRSFDMEKNDFILTAIILRKQYDAPKIVYLNSESQIKELLSKTLLSNGYTTAYDSYGSGGNELYNMIWKPIEDQLEGVNTIYFAPYSIIYNINLEALKKDEGSYCLYELYNMIRVSSTEEICDNRKETNTTAVVFGDIDYYNTSDSYLIDNSKTSNLDKDTVTTIQLRALKEEWEPLYNTKTEIDYITDLLKKNKVKVNVYTQKKGTEKAFKSLSSKPTSIIHLATHGFYFDNAIASNISYYNRGQNSFYINAGLRSGIIFAGANKAWKNSEIEDNSDDGILTADEIMGMDLSATDLLVLSTCQSALGDPESDEIYGIQRSFKIAGVNTIIMSLWEVDDEATSKMMQSFYKHFLSGKTKREAFKAAQLEVKNFYEDRAKTQSKSIPKYKRYDSSYYWASFIMLD